MKSTTIVATVLIIAAIGIGTSAITDSVFANLGDFHITPGKCHQFANFFGAHGHFVTKICKEHK
ncbi:MAG: hypothetical protein ACTHKF_05460 [Candidatus Nitrosocosmicus sp.]